MSHSTLRKHSLTIKDSLAGVCLGALTALIVLGSHTTITIIMITTGLLALIPTPGSRTSTDSEAANSQ